MSESRWEKKRKEFEEKWGNASDMKRYSNYSEYLDDMNACNPTVNQCLDFLREQIDKSENADEKELLKRTIYYIDDACAMAIQAFVNDDEIEELKKENEFLRNRIKEIKKVGFSKEPEIKIELIKQMKRNELLNSQIDNAWGEYFDLTCMPEEDRLSFADYDYKYRLTRKASEMKKVTA